MKYKHFPQANIVLQKGDNENTVGMRAELCTGDPKIYSPDTLFYASQFELEDDEKKAVRDRIESALMKFNGEKINPDALDVIMDALPAVWCISMHGWAPKIISVYGPGDLGYMHKEVPAKPTDN